MRRVFDIYNGVYLNIRRKVESNDIVLNNFYNSERPYLPDTYFLRRSHGGRCICEKFPR